MDAGSQAGSELHKNRAKNICKVSFFPFANADFARKFHPISSPMTTETPITPNDLRKQGEQLVAYGKMIMDAGEQQIEAAAKIEESYALLRQRHFPMPLAQPIDNSESESFSPPFAAGRAYISAIEAAQVALKNGPLELHDLYVNVTSMGARCKNRMSLATMLRQHLDKFEYAGGTKWKLAGASNYSVSRFTATEQESPTNGASNE